MRNINCLMNNHGVFCEDKRVKRSLFGIGCRICLVYDGKECPFRIKHPRPPPPYRIKGKG